MTAIERPTPAQMTRRGVVLAAAVFAVVIAEAQMLMGWGQSAAEFAADSDATLKVAGYAFSIWAAIYVGILIYAVRQAISKTAESTMLNKLGWPSAIAFIGIGLWIIAAAFDWEALTIVLIFASLAALLTPMLMNARHIRALPRRDMDRMAVIWPLALLAGWLTVAAPVNLITVATGDGALPTALSPTSWAILAVVVVVLTALAVTWRLRTLIYALPVAWGLVGVFVAETERNALLAGVAIAAAGVVLVGAVILSFKLRPSVER